jgi:hypothetical protein
VSPEIYERIIDLAIKVAEGKVDPFDVDVGRFLRDISRYGELSTLDFDILVKDINAINGLIMILEAQSKVLKRRGLGLYLDKVLLRLKLYRMDIEDLSRIFSKAWRPIVEVESINLESIKESLFYFNNLKDLMSRRLKFDELREPVSGDVEARYFVLPRRIRERIMSFLEELRDVSRGDFIDYWRFIHMRGDPVERAYLLSFLISDGWVDVKINRLEERIWIRPLDERRPVTNPSTLAVGVKR